jgi:hypothetical protein
MANERLKAAMIKSHVDIAMLSKETDVDPKTVSRWLKGRVPHAKHRWKIATLLNQQENYLWPAGDFISLGDMEVVTTYGRRSDASPAEWWKLFSQAQKNIDMLANAMLFIPEQNTRLVGLLREKAAQGCLIRIALANPACQAVKLRDEEEQLGGTLPGRIKNSLYHFREIIGVNGIEIKYHETILYNSLFRGDEEMFVTPHLYGLHGSMPPLLHLRRLSDNGIFASFATHFNVIWANTLPLE